MTTPNDLPSVGTEDAQALAAMLIVHAGDHKDVAYECDMNPADTLNWKHHVTSLDASKALLTLVSERDELAARVRELEGERDRLKLSKIDRECLRVGQEIQRAAGELPDNYEIQIEVERGSGSVYLSKPDYTAVGFHDMVGGLSHAITEAIAAALTASKGQP